jgi:hypothetical protein
MTGSAHTGGLRLISHWQLAIEGTAVARRPQLYDEAVAGTELFERIFESRHVLYQLQPWQPQ